MKKLKYLSICLITSLPIVGCLSTSVSCSKQANFIQQVLDEFVGNQKLNIKGLTSVPRPGHYHDKIVPYLKQRVKDIAGLDDEQILIDSHGNICFDIPGSKGYENADMVILQGHTDMVVAGLPEEEWTTRSIETVIEGNLLHSKDWKTSIGADDGIGISCALTILKNRNNFTHGPLRFLLTADEDVGMIGAKYVTEDWFIYNNDWVKWLINIDAENEDHVYRSCAGNARITYAKEYDLETSETALNNKYVLTIDGLIGGHSGDLLKKANADRLAYEFLYDLCNNSDVQLIEHNHINEKGVDEKFSANQIISHCKIEFRSNLPQDEINKRWNSRISSWEGIYSDENWTDIAKKSSITSSTTTTTQPFISKENTETLVSIWGNYTDDPTQNLKGIYYGNFKVDGTFPLASQNIGPITIAYDDESNKIKFDGWTSGRSSIGDQQSDENYSINWILRENKKVCNNVITATEGPIYYPWLKDENNELVKILADGYKKLGIDPKVVDGTAGVEPAWWTQTSKGNTTCACIGPHIDNAHNTTETLYINTIEIVYKNLQQSLETLANKK